MIRSPDSFPAGFPRCDECGASGHVTYTRDRRWLCQEHATTASNDFDAGAEPRGDGNGLLVAVVGGIAVLVVLMSLRGCA